MSGRSRSATENTKKRPFLTARRRDRRVYLRSHPVLFALLSVTRRWPVLRWGRTVLVHDRQAYLDGLTRVPLDRVAAGTTGGTARRLEAEGLLFDQEGTAHRGTRRSVHEGLGAAGVDRLRPVWLEVLDRRLAPLAQGGHVDLVPLAMELAGATTAALLDLDVDPLVLAQAARVAAAATAHEQLPGLRWPGRDRAARLAAARLTDLIATATTATDSADGSGLAGMLAVAAINTTVAALPRAVAWCADDRLWDWAADPATRGVLVAELLRVTAPSPLLPRVAASSGTVGGCPVRAGDRLVLVARHAVDAHRSGPDCADPAPARVAQLVFGAGSHACPGARLARAQLSDTLAALAAYRPVVVRARADRRAALPSWASLVIQAGRR
ncbi:cytochrome P450 family protein [Micromonospora polyrhachis]|uniref:Cytochrome P450 n=1 Tax=Micromonospora polyrhachis TaxID=1282883 RepID=A0A7W7SN76_9ACTN|nr:cytochrome P450 [Micromonospora polyrhachis]MBB4956670.1 cytochrome P450 [Micromonospora polyrhachis]